MAIAIGVAAAVAATLFGVVYTAKKCLSSTDEKAKIVSKDVIEKQAKEMLEAKEKQIQLMNEMYIVKVQKVDPEEIKKATAFFPLLNKESESLELDNGYFRVEGDAIKLKEFMVKYNKCTSDSFNDREYKPIHRLLGVDLKIFYLNDSNLKVLCSGIKKILTNNLKSQKRLILGDKALCKFIEDVFAKHIVQTEPTKKGISKEESFALSFGPELKSTIMKLVKVKPTGNTMAHQCAEIVKDKDKSI